MMMMMIIIITNLNPISHRF